MRRTKHSRRRPGDMEIRILPDGRIVMIAPDEKMLEVVKQITQQVPDNSQEVKDNGKGR